MAVNQRYDVDLACAGIQENKTEEFMRHFYKHSRASCAMHTLYASHSSSKQRNTLRAKLDATLETTLLKSAGNRQKAASAEAD
jgi:hypothetical protein